MQGCYPKSQIQRERIRKSMLAYRAAQRANAEKNQPITQPAPMSPILSQETEYQVRPSALEEFVGGEAIKQELQVLLNASPKMGRMVPHILLTGLAGSGKTSLARLIAKLLGVTPIMTDGSLLRKHDDFRHLLLQLYPNDQKNKVIIVDEIHQIKHPEHIFEALEDFCFTLQTEDEMTGLPTHDRVRVPPFTMVGISNRAGELAVPLLERFKIHWTVPEYTSQELEIILHNAAAKLGIAMEPEAITLLAVSSKAIPRIALSYLERCWAFQLAEARPLIDAQLIQQVFQLIGVHEKGLTATDIKALQFLYKIKPRQVGVSRLATICNETTKSFLNTVEPFLSKEGLMLTAPTGRFLSREGAEYLKTHALVDVNAKGGERWLE